jgi:hypothetical protein
MGIGSSLASRQTWKNPSLGQAGTVLLLVGWLLGLVFALGGLIGVVLLLAGRHAGTWLREWMLEGWPWPPRWTPPDWVLFDAWGLAGVFVVLMAVLYLAGVVAGTVFSFAGWRLTSQGYHRMGGLFGVVGGVVLLLVSSVPGIVVLLGGVFVLMGMGPEEDAVAQAADQGGDAVSARGPVAGQYPPERPPPPP